MCFLFVKNDLIFCRFVLLSDCKHICEASALASWFEWQTQNIEALSCPLCETAITLKLRRFKKSVLKPFEGWNKIRNKIELSKAYSASDLHDVLKSVESCFRECEFYLPALKFQKHIFSIKKNVKIAVSLIIYYFTVF